MQYFFSDFADSRISPVPSMPSQNSHPSMLQSIHWQQLYSLADGDEHFALALLRSFVADGDRQLSELRRVIDQGDSQQAHHYLHQMKGASANVGALQVEAIATQLENYLQSFHLPEAEKAISSSCEPLSREAVRLCLDELEKAIAQIRAIAAEQGGGE